MKGKDLTNLPSLTEDDIRRLATPQSFERGERYYASGSVLDAERRGNTLVAHIQGSQYEPYRITVTLGSAGIEKTACTCPYDWGGICKHIVATLLTWVREPDSFHTLTPVDELLAGRSKEDLIALVKEMIGRQPDLARLLELPLGPDSSVPFDLAAFRKQASYALSRDDAEWVARELERLQETADRYLEVDNLTAAGALYHLILDETLARFEDWWLQWDRDGDILCVLGDCAEGLDHCLDRVTDLETRQLWLEALLEAELEDIRLGGVDFAWPAGDVVLRQATDEEWAWIEARLRREMQRARDWGRRALVRFLTARLEMTGRETEADAFVLEHGTPEQRAFLLIQLSRVEEAVNIARQHFVSLPGLVKRFADALVEAGHGEAAVAYMAEQARHERYASHYRPWLARYFEEHGDQEAALELWRRQFAEWPRFETYQELRQLAGELGTWETLRSALLKTLDPQRQASLLLQIALEEGDVAWALEIISRPGARFSANELIRVAQAAEPDHPRAALEIYRRRAERAIAARGRGSYQIATSHLLRGRDLYHRLGEDAAWEAYIAHLRQEHQRPRALQDEPHKAGL
ncbi:MAG: SWIM zinc finger family protein [Anaerolineales bacterium]|nr:SWIM zinc finger family protein [Anaerolineales bacterium]